MGSLSITLIDVGSGDSILIEAKDDAGKRTFALVDSNDKPNWRSTETFLLRHFRNMGVQFGTPHRLFDFVMVSHAHSDHISGVKRLLQEFGSEWFYYPESGNSSEFATLLRYVRRSSAMPTGRVRRHQVINRNTVLPNLGPATLQVLWPPPTALGVPHSSNENDNSIVLGLKIDKAKMLLTGDCEATSWPSIIPNLASANLSVFKVPHHGAVNGFFDKAGNAVWLSSIGTIACLGLSTHVSPYGHPDSNVTQKMEASGLQYYRTDRSYHITFKSSGSSLRIKHSRF